MVFEGEVAPHLGEGNVLVFASGYNIAFDFIAPPPHVNVVLVAPRMIGAGVRELYLSGQGFPSFIGVAQDRSGQARGIALALAKSIGSTQFGVVEVTFAQEAERDLFTERGDPQRQVRPGVGGRAGGGLPGAGEAAGSGPFPAPASVGAGVEASPFRIVVKGVKE
jgi:hypothetical protein